MLTKAYIPYKGYYSTPFAKWQGSLSNENSVVLAGHTSKRWLTEKNWDPEIFDYVLLGITIGQPNWFYGGPWVSALMGAADIPGIIISQACSTSTTCIYQAGLGVETGLYENALALMTDRCSNGPHTIWPNPNGPGGEVISENWNMDNINRDPWAGAPMIRTAENVAGEAGISREECDAVTLRRFEQYQEALADDRAFQKRYMFPAEARLSRKQVIVLEADEGITPSTREGLAGLRTVLPDGVLTFGTQTHPADGNAAVVVTSRDKAKELSADPGVEIQIVSYGYSRAKKSFMPAAVVPAARMALDKAEITMDDVTALKTHNPFVVNDIYLAQEMQIDVNGFNNYGSPLIYGHPQAPTAGRAIMEGLEEVVIKGGGYLLFAGCAAGDTAAAIVLKVGR